MSLELRFEPQILHFIHLGEFLATILLDKRYLLKNPFRVHLFALNNNNFVLKKSKILSKNLRKTEATIIILFYFDLKLLHLISLFLGKINKF